MPWHRHCHMLLPLAAMHPRMHGAFPPLMQWQISSTQSTWTRREYGPAEEAHTFCCAMQQCAMTYPSCRILFREAVLNRTHAQVIWCYRQHLCRDCVWLTPEVQTYRTLACHRIAAQNLGCAPLLCCIIRGCTPNYVLAVVAPGRRSLS